MSKYRTLTNTELEPLKEAFLKFLLVQNILPEEWEKIKRENTTLSKKYIDAFSDMVFEKIMLQTVFVERITDKSVEAYHFMKNEVLLVSLQAKSDFKGNLLEMKPADIQITQFDLLKGKKQYEKSREEDMFALTQKGGVPSDGNWYKALVMLLAAK